RAKRKRLPIRRGGPGVACAFATDFIRVATISVPARSRPYHPDPTGAGVGGATGAPAAGRCPGAAGAGRGGVTPGAPGPAAAAGRAIPGPVGLIPGRGGPPTALPT